jgi:hypothetical protein
MSWVWKEVSMFMMLISQRIKAYLWLKFAQEKVFGPSARLKLQQIPFPRGHVIDPSICGMILGMSSAPFPDCPL